MQIFTIAFIAASLTNAAASQHSLQETGPMEQESAHPRLQAIATTALTDFTQAAYVNSLTTDSEKSGAYFFAIFFANLSIWYYGFVYFLIPILGYLTSPTYFDSLALHQSVMRDIVNFLEVVGVEMIGWQAAIS